MILLSMILVRQHRGLDGKNPAKIRHADARGFREKAKTFQPPLELIAKIFDTTSEKI
jgi:hypothetical protein